MQRNIIVSLACLMALCLVSFAMKADGDTDATSKKTEKTTQQETSSPVDARALKRLDAKVAFEKRMMTALRKKVSVDFLKASVEEVAEVIAEHSGLPVDIEVSAYEEEGIIVKKMDINLVIANVQMITVLDLLERSDDINWTVRNGRIVLTPARDEKLLTRHYLLDDFVDKAKAERDATETVKQTRKWIAQLKKSGTFDEVDARPGLSLPSMEKDFAQLLRQETEHNASYPSDELMNLFFRFTSPVEEGWAEEGGLEGAEIKELPGVPAGSLFVSHTRRSHWEIAELLADLRDVQEPGAKFTGRPLLKHDFISNKPSEHVLKKLEQKIGPLDISADTLIEEVAEHLTKKMGVPVVIDTAALLEDGMVVEDVVTSGDLPTSNTAAEALDFLALDCKLTWLVTRDVIVVTTESVAESFLQTRVFDITSFLDRPGQDFDTDSLLEMIRVCSAWPGSGWAEDGGLEGAECEIFCANGVNALVIRQNSKAMRQVEEVLARLHRCGYKIPTANWEFQSWQPYYGSFGGGMSGGMEGSGNGMGGMGGGGGAMF